MPCFAAILLPEWNTSPGVRALFNFTSSKLPWLDTGELRRNVAPALQERASFAVTPAGRKRLPGPKQINANQIRHFRIGIKMRPFAAAAA
jgi:hypothetical protein